MSIVAAKLKRLFFMVLHFKLVLKPESGLKTVVSDKKTR